ncbi:MAG: type II toxin-antitoxin system HicA family toxin [Patescibacteria group bacterium]
MPKLPRNIKPIQLIKILQKHSFTLARVSGSHHFLKHADGRWTHIAVHPKPIPVGTLKVILSQSGLSEKDIQ